jgi:hypothetical protein
LMHIDLIFFYSLSHCVVKRLTWVLVAIYHKALSMTRVIAQFLWIIFFTFFFFLYFSLSSFEFFTICLRFNF